MDTVFINYMFIPLLIMIARIIDVSIGTIRIVFVARGREYLSAVLGFFEVLIWLVAISQVLTNLTNVASYIAYGLGFALGNIIGLKIEKKLAVGVQIIRIIKKTKLHALQMALRDEGCGVTTVQGYGGKNDIDIVYVVSERKHVPYIIKIVEDVEPDSFVTIQDVSSYQKGYFKRPRFKGFLRK